MIANGKKPALVLIVSSGPPLKDERMIERILNLDQILRHAGKRPITVRTVGEIPLNAPLGFESSVKDSFAQASAILKVHAPDYDPLKMEGYTVDDPADGSKYKVLVCPE